MIGTKFYFNEFQNQLFAGACRNSLANPSTIKRIQKNPPVPLVEKYFECVMLPYDAFFNALGLSLGNAFLYYCRGFDPKLGVFTRPEGEYVFERGMAVAVLPPDETDRKEQ